jgi:hypothetical protein
MREKIRSMYVRNVGIGYKQAQVLVQPGPLSDLQGQDIQGP